MAEAHTIVGQIADSHKSTLSFKQINLALQNTGLHPIKGSKFDSARRSLSCAQAPEHFIIFRGFEASITHIPHPVLEDRN